MSASRIGPPGMRALVRVPLDPRILSPNSRFRGVAPT